MNPQPKIFLLLYAVALLSSLFVVISFCLVSKDFNGNCLLYASGNFTFDAKTNVTKFSLDQWGSRSDCNYIIFVGFTHLITSSILAAAFGLLVWKEHDRAPFGSFVTFIINVMVTFFTFVAALILSVGLQEFCKNLYKAGKNEVCSQVDLSSLKSPSISPLKFFSRIAYIEFGLWFGLCTWLIATMISFFKVYYYHKNDDLLQSLAYEKETLLNRRRNYQQIHSSVSPPEFA